MTNLLDLIAELESAEGPSRELSDDILLACGWHVYPPDWCGSYSQDGDCLGCGNKRPIGVNCVVPRSEQEWTPRERPHVTKSIDAALTLVPEEWRITHAYWGAPGKTAGFTLGTDKRQWVSGLATTPALALAIAALRARLAQEN